MQLVYFPENTLEFYQQRCNSSEEIGTLLARGAIERLARHGVTDSQKH
jgi:hypothetical protein